MNNKTLETLIANTAFATALLFYPVVVGGVIVYDNLRTKAEMMIVGNDGEKRYFWQYKDNSMHLRLNGSALSAIIHDYDGNGTPDELTQLILVRPGGGGCIRYPPTKQNQELFVEYYKKFQEERFPEGKKH